MRPTAAPAALPCEGIACQCLHAVDVQSSCHRRHRTLMTNLSLVLAKSATTLARRDGVYGKAIDQRADHAAPKRLERGAGNSTARQGVLQHVKMHTLAHALTRSLVKSSTVMPRYSAIASVCDFSSLAGHIVTTTLFSLRFKTQGLLLIKTAWPCRLRTAGHSAPHLSSETALRLVQNEDNPPSAGSPSALALRPACTDSRIKSTSCRRLQHQRSWMTGSRCDTDLCSHLSTQALRAAISKDCLRRASAPRMRLRGQQANSFKLGLDVSRAELERRAHGRRDRRTLRR